jgi:hypothetical protein
MTTSNVQPQSSLRQRRNSKVKVSLAIKKNDAGKAVATLQNGLKDTGVSNQACSDEIVWGKTPSGEGAHYISSRKVRNPDPFSFFVSNSLSCAYDA